MLDKTLHNTPEILELLNLAQTDVDRFEGQSHFMGSPNVFGGQVLGQSLHAASMTVDGRRPHSLHSLFILPGNHRLPITFDVERVRDGGSFNTRRVVATQEGRRIFVMSASFQQEEAGLNHQKPMPVHADPDTLESTLRAWQQKAAEYHPAVSAGSRVDFRSDGNGELFSNASRAPYKQVWARAPICACRTTRWCMKPCSPTSPTTACCGLRSSRTVSRWVSRACRSPASTTPSGFTVRSAWTSGCCLRWKARTLRAAGKLCFAHVYIEQGALVATVAQEDDPAARTSPKNELWAEPCSFPKTNNVAFESSALYLYSKWGEAVPCH